MPWNAAVYTSFDFDNVPEQVRKKVNDVALGGGAGGNGNTTIEGNSYQHWPAGSYRIFGSWAREAKKLNFVAYGTHSGKTNTEYKITLYNGKEMRVTTD